MRSEKIQASNKQIRQVTYLGIATNVTLSALKIFAGLAAGSMALFADGIHSISDMATDIVVLLGVHFGSREPDSEHPFGHGKLEMFSAIIMALILIIVGMVMIYKAAMDIAVREVSEHGIAVIIVAVVSIIAKEVLYQITKKAAIKLYSPALYANAWHHRSDAFSSVVVVIGLVSVMLGFAHGDRVAAMFVGLMIILVGVRVVVDNLHELLDVAVDENTVSQIKQIIHSKKQIHQWHNLRTRTVGREVFLDLHILVDPALTVSDGHAIAESLEESLHEEIIRPVNITVHIEPDIPAFRK